MAAASPRGFLPERHVARESLPCEQRGAGFKNFDARGGEPLETEGGSGGMWLNIARVKQEVEGGGGEDLVVGVGVSGR
jgi:hypothetical protein